MNNNPFAEMLAKVSGVDILKQAIPGGVSQLGDKAILDAAANAAAAHGVQFKPEEWTSGDYIFLGMSNQTPGGVTIGAGLTTAFRTPANTPFKPLQVIIASDRAPGLFISSVTIGATNLIAGDPVPAQVISEVSWANRISWPTVQTAQPIDIAVLNATAAPITNVAIGILGWRLRN